jgi:hypothetical protein
MTPMLVVPDYQPVPFPTPLWLLQVLLVLGFFLHAVPMNVIFTGGFISGGLLLAGGNNPDALPSRAGRALANSLPLFLSFAITQGIVPLLFLQLMYGPLYYTSSIMMAWPWFSIIFLLIAAYYGLYWFKYKQAKLGNLGPWILITCNIVFCLVGFFFVNNMTLMLSPQHWAEHLQGMSSFGTGLNLSDPQVVPRYLFYLVGSIGITGLILGCYGWRWTKRNEPELGRYAIGIGSGLFAIAGVAELLVGNWWLGSLSADKAALLTGSDPILHALLLAWMALIGLGVVTSVLTFKTKAVPTFIASFGCGILALLVVSVGRHFLRAAYVSPFLKPEWVPVNIQWDLLIAFVVLAVGLILYLTWLIGVAWRAFNPPITKSPA